MYEIRLLGGPLDGLILSSNIPCDRFDLDSGDLYLGTYDGGTKQAGRIVLHHAGRSTPVAAAKELAREIHKTEELGAKISKQFHDYARSVPIIAGLSFFSAFMPWLWCAAGMALVSLLILAGVLVSKSLDKQYRQRTRFVQQEASGSPELKRAIYDQSPKPNVEQLHPEQET